MHSGSTHIELVPFRACLRRRSFRNEAPSKFDTNPDRSPFLSSLLRHSVFATLIVDFLLIARRSMRRCIGVQHGSLRRTLNCRICSAASTQIAKHALRRRMALAIARTDAEGISVLDEWIASTRSAHVKGRRSQCRHRAYPCPCFSSCLRSRRSGPRQRRSDLRPKAPTLSVFG